MEWEKFGYDSHEEMAKQWVAAIMNRDEPGVIKQPEPTLDKVKCVAYNRKGEVIMEEMMPECEFLKSFVKPMFDHHERINKGSTFRVW